MSRHWVLTDQEWALLQPILTGPTHPDKRGPGRPRQDNDRLAAQACLYRHFHSHSTGRSHSFGWNRLPDTLAISPATANRRFREWSAAGSWNRFWDALNRIRRSGEPHLDNRRNLDFDSCHPVSPIVEELERAYGFFREWFFALDDLPRLVAITLDDDGSGGRRLGSFCGRRWRDQHREVNHIRIRTVALGNGAEPILAVLLHEMVHLRNFEHGIVDCSRNQYHNRHFRDVARVAGLECMERDTQRGYGITWLSSRGLEAIADFEPSHEIFRWTTR